jgi:hypothetical protein
MIASFLTHYYEADRGPFRNICDLSDNELNGLITVEKDAPTAFNRFALGKEFFEIRRSADDLLIEKYKEKFGVTPEIRPFYAVLGEFNRMTTMYRNGRSLHIELSHLGRTQVTFMYPDHFVLVWSQGLFPPLPALFPPPARYAYEPIHGLLFSYDELAEVMRMYALEHRITAARQMNLWVSSYVEAHIWDPNIHEKIST